jgi:hypothetical protein
LRDANGTPDKIQHRPLTFVPQRLRQGVPVRGGDESANSLADGAGTCQRRPWRRCANGVPFAQMWTCASTIIMAASLPSSAPIIAGFRATSPVGRYSATLLCPRIAYRSGSAIERGMIEIRGILGTSPQRPVYTSVF